MKFRDSHLPAGYAGESSRAGGTVRRWLLLSASIVLLPLCTLAAGPFVEYRDVRELLAEVADVLPQQLRSADTVALSRLWPAWVAAHDREIRGRLAGGDEDTIINWLLFGTSFTRQPRTFFDTKPTPDALRRLIAARTLDFVSALGSPDTDERVTFARSVLRSQGYGFEKVEERSRLVEHLFAEVDRVIAERQRFMQQEDGAAGDLIEQILVQAQLFHDRGISLDTSILSSFAIDQAMETMTNQRELESGQIRRVAVIGPGLDFADKNSGYDFYPLQTLQPFAVVDSLVRLGLVAKPEDVELTTFDISSRVNGHLQTLRERARVKASYILRLPKETNAHWTPELIEYWRQLGNRIGSAGLTSSPVNMPKGVDVREVNVSPQAMSRIEPVDFNIVTQRWTGPPFDLVIATNVLVYYDRLDQALAFSAVEGMLRPGGFFITNNVVVEPQASRLRSTGLRTVRHTDVDVDHVFWYRLESSGANR